MPLRWNRAESTWFFHHAPMSQPKWWSHGNQVTMYTATGTNRKAITMPSNSRAMARPSAPAQERSPRWRRAVSHMSAMITAANSAIAPDHFTEAAAPNAAPAASRQGRTTGEKAGGGGGGDDTASSPVRAT